MNPNGESDFRSSVRYLDVFRLVTEGSYLRALPLCESLLADTLKSKGDLDLDSATAFELLADIQRALGRIEDAKNNYRESLLIRKTTAGDDHLSAASSMNKLGNVLSDFGAYDEARAYYQQAIAIWTRELGKDHHETLGGVHDLGLLLRRMGDLSGARMTLERALNGFERLNGPDDLETAHCRDSCGQVLLAIGEYEAARRAFEAALDVRRRRLGSYHPDVGDSLNNLGFALNALGDFVPSQRLLEEALSIYIAVFGERHPNVANAINNIAIVLQNVGALEQARLAFERSLAVYETLFGSDHPDTARLHDNVGGLASQLGLFAEAKPHLDAALLFRRKVLGPTHPETLTTLGRLALVAEKLGQYQHARNLNEEVLNARRLLFGDIHADTQASFNNFGLCLIQMGDYAPAREYLELNLRSARALYGENHPSTMQAFNSLGALYRDMGDLKQAEQLHRAALDIRLSTFGENHHETAESLTNLAGVLKAQSNYEAATSYEERALKAFLAVGGEAYPGTRTAMEGLAVLRTVTGDFDEAEKLLQRVLSLKTGALGRDHDSTARTLHNLGYLRGERGDHAGAIPFLEEALEILSRLLGEQHADLAPTLSGLMVEYAVSFKPDKALKMAKRLASCDDRQISQIFAIGSDRQRVAVRDMARNHFEATLSLVLRYLMDSVGAVEFAFGLVLRRKALRLEALVVQRDATYGERYPHLKASIVELSSARARLAAMTFDAARSGLGEQGEKLRADIEQELERLEVMLARQIPEVGLSRELSAADLPTVADKMGDAQVLVEFVRFEHFAFESDSRDRSSPWMPASYAAFILRGGECTQLQMLDLGEADSIDSAIQGFVDCCAMRPERRVGASLTQLGSIVRERVYEPIKEFLPPNCTLVISPDGMIYRLPFAALPIEGGFLNDKFPVSYVSSGRDVIRFGRQATAKARECLVVADPAFNLSAPEPVAVAERPAGSQVNGAFEAGHRSYSRYRFWRLKGTREEGEAIAPLLGVAPVMGDAALDATVKGCRSPRILHLATHGFFWSEDNVKGIFGNTSISDPLLRSGLALAGANVWLRGGEVPEGVEDGLLTAHDVSEMDLLDTELVVLSACDTGLGDFQDGEGLFGLRRAFAIAGARRLVMSLWKVDDWQTQKLMVAFYSELIAGKAAVDALRQAQSSTRQDAFSDPYYWAAFVLQGEPGRLR